jgi:adenylate cyclase
VVNLRFYTKGFVMAKHEKVSEDVVRDVWHSYITKGEMPDYINKPWWASKRFRQIFNHLPSNPRCQYCYYPFEGIGGSIMRGFFGVQPSKLNPHLCNLCDQFVERYQGGAEVEITILFADIRGSTQLAEQMNPTEFGRLINRFYNTTTSILFDHDAMVEKIAGDAITAFFSPGFSDNHARAAVETAREIIRATGHRSPTGPWIPLGIGIHTGMAYVGAVRADSGAGDIAVLGDTANTGARLSAVAGAGEIYISSATAARAGLADDGVLKQHLNLKGRSEPIEAWVL